MDNNFNNCNYFFFTFASYFLVKKLNFDSRETGHEKIPHLIK